MSEWRVYRSPDERTAGIITEQGTIIVPAVLTVAQASELVTLHNTAADPRAIVYATVRRLPNAVQVYNPKLAADLALYFTAKAGDSTMGEAIAEDTWHGIKDDWPVLE